MSEEEKEQIILTEMGFCVKKITSYYRVTDDVNYPPDSPDKMLLVQLCDDTYKSFNVFGDEIIEQVNDNDGDPF